MPEIIGVRFRNQSKIYYFASEGIKFKEEDQVIVETVRGLECGSVATENKTIKDQDVNQPLKPVMRIATKEDLQQVRDNRRKEREAVALIENKILEHKLDMHVVRSEYTFDCTKLTIYFTSDGRVDFRKLVRDLASIFRTRIELRQIGVRDEAKMLGGLGICGREFCCTNFLEEFSPVSIRMAKTQGLSLNPSKISGICGRLMCCLNYEQDVYVELAKTTPRKNSIVTTSMGRGKIIDVSLLTGILRVLVEDEDGNNTVEEFHKDDVKVIK